MVANFSTIRAAIKTKLQADTDLANGEVFDYAPPIESVTKDPWASIEAEENESTFETTSENKRTFTFLVRVFVARDANESGAETLLTSIVDRLLDAFDQDYDLGVAGVLFTKAAPSSWGYVLAEKTYRYAEIRLSTIASIDVSP